ncbi:MAG TPA: hypothetical protein VGF44_00825 [Terriglobales bacterium]
MHTSRRWYDDPLILLALVVCLGTFLAQSGELGSADTMHRLQTAHSFWTAEPPVFPQEYPEFGVHGRGGKIYDWYGIGQPILMLPADIVGTYIAKLHVFAAYGDTDPTVRNIFVTYTINILISLLTALISLRLLRQLEFTPKQSIAGALALIFCTTHLHYSQNMMENNYIMLLTLIGFSYQYEWLREGKRNALLIGSAAFGLNLLTRLTTAVDIFVGGIFLLLVLFFQKAGLRSMSDRIVAYIKVSAPVYGFFFLLDRLYQFHRFGTFLNTYVHYFTIEHRLQDPTLPANYPWETPFHVGFLGPLITPEKSIFLFDPLMILAVVLAIWSWKRLLPEVKAYIVASFLLLLGYICVYARYTVWSGDFAWGDRYVSTAAELAAFISVPLLFRFRKEIARPLWVAGIALIAISAIIQAASLMFWLSLEIYQLETLGHPTFIVWLRFKNILAFALGKMDAWGLNNEAMTQDPWDYVHITTWNFLPFVLRRVGEAPVWVVKLASVIWGMVLAAFIAVSAQLARVLAKPDYMEL